MITAFLSIAGAKVQQKKQSAKLLTDYFCMMSKKVDFVVKKELSKQVEIPLLLRLTWLDSLISQRIPTLSLQFELLIVASDENVAQRFFGDVTNKFNIL